jgi:hypothetical protein
MALVWGVVEIGIAIGSRMGEARRRTAGAAMRMLFEPQMDSDEHRWGSVLRTRLLVEGCCLFWGTISIPISISIPMACFN